jgi:hypothetical protein
MSRHTSEQPGEYITQWLRTFLTTQLCTNSSSVTHDWSHSHTLHSSLGLIISNPWLITLSDSPLIIWFALELSQYKENVETEDLKPVIICVATDPETNQVRLEWHEEIVIFMSLKPYLVSFRISSYTDYDWFHDYYFFSSLKPYLVSFRISSYR